ncbi:MAG: T9SS type A sorting domain-containing protein [Flavobacteriales bacterium]|nr:T9SS type A sorting domain-containing protein [Flavobacteriales bacterium]
MSGDFAFNDPYIVKYDAGLTALWSASTFEVMDMERLAADCLVMGGSHSADITLEGTTYTRPNGPGQENAMAAFFCSGAVSLSEVSPAVAIAVYPNPCSDRLFLKGSAPIAPRIQVLDALGRTVLERAYTANGLDVSDLTKGSYLLRISSPDGQRMVRFVKD